MGRKSIRSGGNFLFLIANAIKSIRLLSRMKRLIICIVAVGAVIGILLVVNFSSIKTLPLNQSIGMNKWMSQVNNAVPLSSLSIPGSHNSAALYEPFPGTAKCQDYTVGDQLSMGVRFLDIRLRHCNNQLKVYHGPIDQRQDFTGILNQTTRFLSINPSECIIMSIKEEYTSSGNNESFEQAFLRYVNNPAYKSYWWRNRYIPTLGEVRGKIVLFRRFNGAPEVSGGIDMSHWPDNASFTNNDSKNAVIEVQDQYQVNHLENKEKLVIQMIDTAANNSSNRWYINFASGVRPTLGIPNIPSVSNNINPKLMDIWSTKRKTTGVIIYDHITPKLCKAQAGINQKD